MSELCIDGARPMAAGRLPSASRDAAPPRGLLGLRLPRGSRRRDPRLSDHLLRDIGLSHADLVAMDL